MGASPLKDDLVTLFTYNRWADRLVLESCRKLTPDQFVAEPVPGWSSVRSTLYHIAIVTEGWLRGFTEDVGEDPPSEDTFPTVDHIERHLDKAYEIFDALIPALTPDRLAEMQTFRRGTRAATLPRWAVLRHLVNHSTYHRGQIAAKLKRFGIEPPATDFIFWVLAQVPQNP